MTASVREQAPLSWPIPPTPLLGREAEVAALCALLADDDTRLVTLTGPGGVGKTRLALGVLAELARYGDSEIVFVPVEHLRDPALLPGTIAAALGLREAGATPLLELVAGALNERSPLLVLDNLEQIAAGAAETIARLLAASPTLTILATSRMPLSIRGERRFPLAPLPLSEPGDAASEGNPAVALFVARAQAVRPDFALTGANRQTVAEVCRRLDGLPLAIELAAARSRSLSPEALLARLSNRLTPLGEGPVDLPERQRTLQATIAWSHDLLRERERGAFRRLATIPAGFGLDLAAAVTELSADEALGAIDTLLDQSLLTVAASDGPEPRFAMLQTIRDFGVQQAAAHDELDRARQSLAEHVLGRATEIRAGLIGPEAHVWRVWCTRERANTTAAIDRFVERGDGASALTLAGALGVFWYDGGFYREGVTLLERVLACAEGAALEERASAYNRLASLHHRLDCLDGEGAALDRAAELYELAGDAAGQATTKHNRALLAKARGDYGAATAGLERAIELATTTGDARFRARAEGNLGTVYESLGDHGRAAELHARALAGSRSTGDEAMIATSSRRLAMALAALGDVEAAVAPVEEARSIFERLGMRSQLAYCLNSLGSLKAAQGDIAGSEQRHREALAVWEELGEQKGLAVALCHLGERALSRGDAAEAVTRFRRGLELGRTIGQPRYIAWAVGGFAGAALAAGQPERGTRLYAYSHALAHRDGPGAADVEDLRPRLRRALGKARFDAAWKTGTAMSLDEALVETELIVVPTRATGARPTVAPVKVPPTAALTDQDHGLTARELDVLRQVAAGKTNAEIGESLFISPFTAKTHVANLLGKLGAETRAAASTWGVRHGLL